MMHLIDDEQGSTAAEFSKVQVWRRRNRLVGGDVPGQSPAGVPLIVGCPNGKRVA